MGNGFHDSLNDTCWPRIPGQYEVSPNTNPAPTKGTGIIPSYPGYYHTKTITSNPVPQIEDNDITNILITKEKDLIEQIKDLDDDQLDLLHKKFEKLINNIEEERLRRL